MIKIHKITKCILAIIALVVLVSVLSFVEFPSGSTWPIILLIVLGIVVFVADVFVL